MSMPRRRWLAAGALFALASAALPLQAAEYPSQPLRIIVPYPAGSTLEVVARTAAEVYQHRLGQPAIVVNVPGGSAAIGTRQAAQAKADGYTLMLGTNQTHGANSALYPDLGYDAVKDFEPIARLGRLQHVLVVRKDLGVQTLAQFLALARKPGNPLNYGSSGNGSASHLIAEMFKRSAGVPMSHIPFKGASDVAQSLMGGHIDAAFATTPSVLPLIRNGGMVALAVASPDRSAALPEVPTLSEHDIRGVEADAWTALFVPAGTPAPIVARLVDVTVAAFSEPATREKIAATGFIPEAMPPAEFKVFLTEDMARWARTIREAGVKID